MSVACPACKALGYAENEIGRTLPITINGADVGLTLAVAGSDFFFAKIVALDVKLAQKARKSSRERQTLREAKEKKLTLSITDGNKDKVRMFIVQYFLGERNFMRKHLKTSLKEFETNSSKLVRS